MSTSLQHVMVVGGTPKGWETFGVDELDAMVARLGDVAAAAGATWLTIRPYGPDPAASTGDWPRHVTSRDRCTVIVDPAADGRATFAAAASSIPPDEDVNEAALARGLYAPADVEPDLIVVLGPPNRLPPSLVWELAYAELVFLDRDSPQHLTSSELRLSIDAFHGRHRRFGGLDDT